jgi:hypothetical protein
VSVQVELLPIDRPTPEEIIARAIDEHQPVRKFALLSGGDGSLSASEVAMRLVPGCEVAHIVTGIGIEKTRLFVRDTCERQGWKLTEIRAKEDCGQDYDEIVRRHGFPGPAAHSLMYRRLKERAIEDLVRRSKKQRSDRVMFFTGICHDDSQRRSGYGGAEITRRYAQVWVNHMYWAGKSAIYHNLVRSGLPRNPVAVELGMSGECGCGAFAEEGELAIWRRADPDFGRRIDRLQLETQALGVHCRWEGRPPRGRQNAGTPDLFQPMCVNCLKSQRAA